MAKIRTNNFLDTVHEVFTQAKEEGVMHLYAEGDKFLGRKIKIAGKEMYHFGTTGYLGLEQDTRLKKSAIDAIMRYGTQFPLSKAYVSHPLYKELEEKLSTIYGGNPIIITKNSTLGHIGVIPCLVREEDGVILDHQVHWSVQNAVELVKSKSVPVEMIRHNNLEMLETKIRELSSKCVKIWYMADGIYSMYGDYSPIEDLKNLALKYPQLHLYYDDVHGMSWKGKNGSGYVMSILKELPENTVIFGTLSKTFGASGSVMVCADRKLHSRIKTYGGPLTFSAQLDPASVGAAIASANIHLSPEIYDLQDELRSKVEYFNSLLEETDLPLIEKNDSPVFYIGTGMPITGYKLVKRLMDEGFYVNLGIFPAVPVKNTGLRITISRHNQKKEIKALTKAIQYHFPLALEETGSGLNRVRRAFKLPINTEENNTKSSSTFEIIEETSIHDMDKTLWNSLMGERNVFDWEGLAFLEKVFQDQKKPENNWDFYYFLIKDKSGAPVLCTFFTFNLWKDDMLAPASVSKKIEEKRKTDPYLHTSKVLNMGSIFTEGSHLYLDQSHPHWKKAFELLLKKIEEIDSSHNPAMTVLRDFSNENQELNEFLLNQGFVKTTMPEACVYDTFNWTSTEEYIGTLSKKSRKHFLKDIETYQNKFDVVIKKELQDKEVNHFHSLYKNVKENNAGLNTFTYPKELIKEMSQNQNWEFIILYLKGEYVKLDQPLAVGVMFCYKNLGHTYVPNYIGMDYKYARKFQVYRQLLFQTILRAKLLGYKKIDFGLTAAFEKRKVGAKVIPKFSYVQAKDNFFLERLEVLRNEN